MPSVRTDSPMQEVETERVLVVPTARFHSLGHFQGFLAGGEVNRYLVELLRPDQTSFRPRGEMEEDPAYKQLIPYVVFRHRDPGGGEAVFAYTRGTGQGEDRLHRKRSIGIGGHISSCDAAAGQADPYREGMRRELEEEVLVESSCRERIVGLINDDETAVGRVHLGVVHLCDVEAPHVAPREPEIIEAGFRPVQELLTSLDEFETWSQITLKALFG